MSKGAVEDKDGRTRTDIESDHRAKASAEAAEALFDLKEGFADP